MTLFDSHAHLDFVENLVDALKRAKDESIEKIISVGTTIEESKAAIKIAEKYSSGDFQIYTSAGIHPKDGKEDVEKFGIEKCIESLQTIAKSSPKVVAIGECGLDYRQETEHNDQFQHELLKAQIDLAHKLNLPIIIHCRNGWDEIFNLLTINDKQSLRSSQAAGLKRLTSIGVFHSFTGNWSAAQKALSLGFYISFSGIVTFKNAPEIQEVAKKMPPDMMLIETDSPFLSPEPFRGKTNEPKNVKIIAQFIAGLRGLPFAKIAETTTKNAQDLFKLNKSQILNPKL